MKRFLILLMVLFPSICLGIGSSGPGGGNVSLDLTTSDLNVSDSVTSPLIVVSTVAGKVGGIVSISSASNSVSSAIRVDANNQVTITTLVTTTTLNTGFTSNGASIINNTLTVNSTVTTRGIDSNGTLTVDNNAIINGTVTVQGISASGASTLNNTLTVNGTVNSSTITTTGADFNGAVNVDNILTVNGTISASTVTVSGIDSNGAVNVDNNAVINGTITVQGISNSGASTLNNTLVVNSTITSAGIDSNGAVNVDNTLTVNGTIYASGNIDGNNLLRIGYANSPIRVGQKVGIDTSNTYSGMCLTTWDNANTYSIFDFNKSSNDTLGTQTLVENNGVIGSIIFRASDGSGFIDSSQISADVDGESGTNDMPGRLKFLTTNDGASGCTEKMRVDSKGDVNVYIGSTTVNMLTAEGNIVNNGTTTTKGFISNGLTIVNNQVTINGKITSPIGILNIVDEFMDVPAKSTCSVFNVTIDSTTLFAGTTAFPITHLSLIQPSLPRTIQVGFWYSGLSSTSNVRGNFRISGTDGRGNSTYEVIAGSAVALNSTNSGSVAFGRIDSVSIESSTSTCADGELPCYLTDTMPISINVGLNDVFGLSNSVSAGDLYKINETGINISTAAVTINTTYSTVTTSNTCNGTYDYKYWIKARNR